MNDAGGKTARHVCRAGERDGVRRTCLCLLIIVAALCLCACGSGGDEPANTAGQPPANAAAAQTKPAAPAGTKLKVRDVTASNTGPGDSAPANTIDGDTSTLWNAGAGAPQWLQLDLGAPTAITRVRLNVAQTPTGPTTHQVYGGPTPAQLKLLGTLDAVTADGQWLELAAHADDVRYLMISTVKSPSWIAWREVEVYK